MNKQQKSDIDTLYWVSDVMQSEDKMELNSEQFKNVKSLMSLLELDPRYKYELVNQTLLKSKK